MQNAPKKTGTTTAAAAANTTTTTTTKCNINNHYCCRHGMARLSPPHTFFVEDVQHRALHLVPRRVAQQCGDDRGSREEGGRKGTKRSEAVGEAAVVDVGGGNAPGVRRGQRLLRHRRRRRRSCGRLCCRGGFCCRQGRPQERVVRG